MTSDSNCVCLIHGRWYDLSAFNHPGGPIALGLANARDATALFEAHHSLSERKSLLSELNRYQVLSHDGVFEHPRFSLRRCLSIVSVYAASCHIR